MKTHLQTSDFFFHYDQCCNKPMICSYLSSHFIQEVLLCRIKKKVLFDRRNSETAGIQTCVSLENYNIAIFTSRRNVTPFHSTSINIW